MVKTFYKGIIKTYTRSFEHGSVMPFTSAYRVGILWRKKIGSQLFRSCPFMSKLITAVKIYIVEYTSSRSIAPVASITEPGIRGPPPAIPIVLGCSARLL